MSTVTYTPSHPVVFVFDYTNRSVTIPKYDPDNTVSSNESCVSIHTLSSADGDVTVSLERVLLPEESHQGTAVYDGHIVAPSGRLALVSAENEVLLEVGNVCTKAEVRVFVDDVRWPSRIWIQVS
jgi:hypothetical protein